MKRKSVEKLFYKLAVRRVKKLPPSLSLSFSRRLSNLTFRGSFSIAKSRRSNKYSSLFDFESEAYSFDFATSFYILYIIIGTSRFNQLLSTHLSSTSVSSSLSPCAIESSTSTRIIAVPCQITFKFRNYIWRE